MTIRSRSPIKLRNPVRSPCDEEGGFRNPLRSPVKWANNTLLHDSPQTAPGRAVVDEVPQSRLQLFSPFGGQEQALVPMVEVQNNEQQNGRRRRPALLDLDFSGAGRDATMIAAPVVDRLSARGHDICRIGFGHLVCCMPFIAILFFVSAIAIFGEPNALTIQALNCTLIVLFLYVAALGYILFKWDKLSQ